MIRHALRSMVLASCWCALVAPPIAAQTTDTPEVQLARIHVAQMPVGSTVKVWTRDGRRFKAVLLSVDASAIRIKPATRVPEPSRLLSLDRIERIERDHDRVSVGKYVGVGASIGAAVLLVLLAGG
jgi:hypothetical protein